MTAPDTKARLLRQRVSVASTRLDTAGQSMGRRWRDGSRVTIEVSDRAPRAGEVWAFCAADGRVILHRYAGRRQGLHVFRGDARLRSDQPVPTRWLIGRVREVDDGRRRWPPRRSHLVLPRTVALVRAVGARLRRRFRADRATPSTVAVPDAPSRNPQVSSRNPQVSRAMGHARLSPER